MGWLCPLSYAVLASSENSKCCGIFCMRPHNPRTRHKRGESCNRAVPAPASGLTGMRHHIEDARAVGLIR